MNGVPLVKLPQTPVNIVYIVVFTLSGVTLAGVLSLCGTLYFKNYADPTILTTIVGITNLALGAVAGILSNTRQQPEDPSHPHVERERPPAEPVKSRKRK